MGLYEAMKILQYKPYHMAEVVGTGGILHMKVLEEAIAAQQDRSGTKPYDKADFEKWMGEYDCAIEIPSFLGLDYYRDYAEDPGVKFILTERDPDRWVRSVNNTAGYVVNTVTSFPVNMLKHFDPFLRAFASLNQAIYWSLSDGTNPGDANNETALRRNYVE